MRAVAGTVRWSHVESGGSSWISLNFTDLREKPDAAECTHSYPHRTLSRRSGGGNTMIAHLTLLVAALVAAAVAALAVPSTTAAEHPAGHALSPASLPAAGR
jgi:hypothetical protein